MLAQLIRQIYKPRKDWAKKGDFGRLLVIGGSWVYTGCIALNALAALRSGADLVLILAPERAANIAASFAPDLIAVPAEGKNLGRKHVKQALELAEKADAVVVGCGLLEPSFEFILEFLQELDKPAVIDAGAIHAVARRKEVLKGNFVLTPHAGEFLSLTGEKPPVELERRVELVKKAALELGSVILLKGHVDVISDGNRVYLNRTGTPYMTVAGTGDVLAGVIGAILARKVKPFEAACAGTYLTGLAGEIASKRFGESLTASDVIEALPEALGGVARS